MSQSVQQMCVCLFVDDGIIAFDASPAVLLIIILTVVSFS
jgi:hypothetical protein